MQGICTDSIGGLRNPPATFTLSGANEGTDYWLLFTSTAPPTSLPNTYYPIPNPPKEKLMHQHNEEEERIQIEIDEID